MKILNMWVLIVLFCGAAFGEIPTNAEVKKITAKELRSILSVQMSRLDCKSFLGYKDGMAYVEVAFEQNGKKCKELYCAPQSDLDKDALLELENLNKHNKRQAEVLMAQTQPQNGEIIPQDDPSGTLTVSPGIIPPVPLEEQIVSVQKPSKGDLKYLNYVAKEEMSAATPFIVETLTVPHDVFVVYHELPKVSMIQLKYIWPMPDVFSKLPCNDINVEKIGENNLWIKAFFGKDLSKLKNQFISIYRNQFVHYMLPCDSKNGYSVRVLSKPQDKTMHYPAEVQYLLNKTFLPSGKPNEILSPVVLKTLESSPVSQNFPLVQNILTSLPISSELRNGQWNLQSCSVKYDTRVLVMIFKARYPELNNRDVFLQFTFGKTATLVQIYGLGLQYLAKSQLVLN